MELNVRDVRTPCTFQSETVRYGIYMRVENVSIRTFVWNLFKFLICHRYINEIYMEKLALLNHQRVWSYAGKTAKSIWYVGNMLSWSDLRYIKYIWIDFKKRRSISIWRNFLFVVPHSFLLNFFLEWSCFPAVSYFVRDLKSHFWVFLIMYVQFTCRCKWTSIFFCSRTNNYLNTKG